MKHLLLLLTLALSTISTINAQDSTWSVYGDWSAESVLGADETESYAFSDGILIQGALGDKEDNLTLGVRNYYGEDGGIKIKFQISNTSYKFDSTEADINYVSAKIIVDGNKNNIIEMTGRVYNSNGSVSIYGDNFEQFYRAMKTGKVIHMKLGTNQVFKFSAIGFAKAKSAILNALRNKGNGTANPFATTENSDNPF